MAYPSSSSSSSSSSSGPSLTHLLPPTYKRQIASWLEEDCPSFDYGGYVVGDGEATAYLWCKSPGVLAGVPFFEEVFRQVGCQVVWHVKEGTWVDPTTTATNKSASNDDDINTEPKATSHTAIAAPTTSNGTSTKPSDTSSLPAPATPISTSTSTGRTHMATVTGPTNSILLGERLALNILARCSGIATASARLLAQVRAHGYRGTLAGTRKTTPGFRLVEKYGMLVGGCDTHRVDLSGMVMLKDNHVLACRHQHSAPSGTGAGTGTGPPSGDSSGGGGGGIATAIQRARRAAGFTTKIEVEVASERDAQEAIDAGADVVMLDNFPLAPPLPPRSLPSTSTPSAPASASAPHPATAPNNNNNNVNNEEHDQSVAAVARRLKRRYRGRRNFLIEVSGGITEANVGGYLVGCGATTEEGGEGREDGDGDGDGGDDGVDVVSTSAIHQGVKHVDFSLKVI